jgi:DNA-binding Xre family transcriptional regulator
MPRVNLGRDPTKERQEATRRIIKRGMIEQGIERQTDMARKIGMSQPSFSTKLRASSWSLEEMVKICNALKLTPEDGSAILGIK